ncbi:MAG: lipid-A-disaccharide synthase [Bacteroidetes bacterium]|nr:lipid-A-disaccharide synthase [Bacteroidota bacterium]MDA1143576.1 lipid-A-disaccharide synthase [Bacteroidota bacterium]
MKYYIIAGEASGDLHGSYLVKHLMKIDANAQIRAWGGDLMETQGASLAIHYKEIAVMGFIDVLKKLPQIFKNISFCKKDLLEFKPDAVIFIDFSGFNLRIAPWAKENGFATHYYIAPQVWASRPNRVQKIKSSIDHLYVTLPFELEFYKKYHYSPAFVGHPLLDPISDLKAPEKNWAKTQNLALEKPIIALLPGSRKGEIKAVLPLLVKTCNTFKHHQFVLAAAPNISLKMYTDIIGDAPVKIVQDETYALLQHAKAALVTSGTATLETALIGVPQIVCYKTQWLTYWIAKKIITLPYISLVNLILDKEAVPELIQNNLNVKNLNAHLNNILVGAEREDQLENYQILKQKLGAGGAAERTATAIVHSLKSSK